MQVKAERCDLCGTAEYEWAENKRAYEPVETTCMGCYMKELAENEDNNRFPGTSVTLMKTGTVTHAKYLVSQRRGMGSSGRH